MVANDSFGIDRSVICERCVASVGEILMLSTTPCLSLSLDPVHFSGA